MKIQRQKYANSTKAKKWRHRLSEKTEVKERRKERDTDFLMAPKRENIEESIGIMYLKDQELGYRNKPEIRKMNKRTSR